MPCCWTDGRCSKLRKQTARKQTRPKCIYEMAPYGTAGNQVKKKKTSHCICNSLSATAPSFSHPSQQMFVVIVRNAYVLMSTRTKIVNEPFITQFHMMGFHTISNNLPLQQALYLISMQTKNKPVKLKLIHLYNILLQACPKGLHLKRSNKAAVIV